MSRSRFQYLAVALLGLVIAACSGSSPTPTPAAAATAAPATPIPTTPASSQAPSASPSTGGSIAAPSIALPSGSFAIPSFALPHEDPALEAQLPSTLGGAQLVKGSFKGSSFLQGAGSNAQQYQAFLGVLGKSPSDVSFAIAFDMSGGSGIGAGAFRIAGADQGQLLAAFQNATQQASSGAQISQANLGGKAVTKIVQGTSSQTEYVYAKGDTLFFVYASDDATAGAALQSMP